MLSREAIINSEAMLLALGEQAFDSYDIQEKNSKIPSNAVVAISVLLSRNGNESFTNVSDIVFGDIFEDEKQAEIALRYTQAISTLKQAREMEEDGIGFEKKVLIAIGRIAELEEGAGEEIEEAKEMVEEFFGDPINTIRFDYLSRQLFPQFNN